MKESYPETTPLPLLELLEEYLDTTERYQMLEFLPQWYQ
jgi:hypothetical protein